MTYLARFLLICTALLLALRWVLGKIFGSSYSRQTRSRSTKQKSISGQTFKDPQCGMYVASSLAVSHHVGGEELHFCSTRCRDEYVAEHLEATGSEARSA